MPLRKGLKTTALSAVPAANSSLWNENQARIFNFPLTPNAVAEYFCSLYRRRDSHICKFPGRERWQTWRGALEDHQILAVISDGGRGGIFRGCHWAEETRFAVLDIDAPSQYHNAEKLARLLAAVESVGLKTIPYQSSDSGGWHLYIPLAGWHNSSEVEHTLKRWLKTLSYEIKGGQLEIFPSGNALRLPLQPGFAWLDREGAVIQGREDLTLEQALTNFLLDLEQNASDWLIAKNRMESQIHIADRAAGREDQAHQKAISNEGFDELFNYTEISEQCEKARKYLASGLTKEGTRHEALFSIQHLLWHGDRWLGIPRLPGRKNAAKRFNFLRQWIEQNHNGKCSHINRGDWRTIEAHIFRLVNWQRSDLPRLSNYEPYRATEKAEERLFELFMATGRIFSMDDLKKANDDREEESRKKITEAVEKLTASGQKVSGRKLSQVTGCSRNTIRKHSDIWLQTGSGVVIRGGPGGLGVVRGSFGLEFEEERKPVLEIESVSQAGCVLDSLRSDRTGQTAINSRQVIPEVLAAVHPIQSNYGVKHELQGPFLGHLVTAEGRDCGINGILPASGSPQFNPRPIFSIGAPAQNLRQVGNRCNGLAIKLDCSKRLSAWLLSSYGYIALSSGGKVMATEAYEKPEEPQRSAERQPEHTKQAQSEANAGSQNYADQVKAYRQEQKLKGKSKATGAGADAYGKGGLASAKDILGEDAHGTTKAEKQAALLAQLERDGYIVRKSQEKPVVIAQNWDGLKRLGMDAGEGALEKAGFFVHRGNEDKYVDYKVAQEAFKTAGLDKLGLPNNLIGAIMRNEQHYYKNTDADQDKEVKEKGTVFKDGKENPKASIGPAQMQIRNIKHLIEMKNADGKPEYTYLQHMKDDPIRGALDPKNAAFLVAAHTNEIVKDLKAHGIQKPTAEQVIYVYNDDVNSYGTGKDKKFVCVSAPGTASSEKLMHPDLRRERIPNDLRILENSDHVRHVMHALDEVNKKFPLVKSPSISPESPDQKNHGTR
jgi:hypothetical protein